MMDYLDVRVWPGDYASVKCSQRHTDFTPSPDVERPVLSQIDMQRVRILDHNQWPIVIPHNLVSH
jgi:hypothetical protein